MNVCSRPTDARLADGPKSGARRFVYGFFALILFGVVSYSASLALLDRLLTAINTIDEAIVILAFFSASHEFFVQVEVFLVSFHVSLGENPDLSTRCPHKGTGLRTIYESRGFSTVPCCSATGDRRAPASRA